MLKFLHDFLGPKFSSLARTMDSMLKLVGEVKRLTILSFQAVDHKQAAMAEFLIEHGAAKAVDFPFLLHVLDARMYKTAELILYENNHIAESTQLWLSISSPDVSRRINRIGRYYDKRTRRNLQVFGPCCR